MASSNDLASPGQEDGQVYGRKGTTGNLCAPCLRTNTEVDAKRFCYDCQEYQCKKCSKKCRQSHALFKAVSGQKLQRIKERNAFSLSVDMKGLDICKQHNKPLQYVCVDHDQLCCSTCKAVLHQDCNEVKEIGNVAREEKVNIGAIKSELRELENCATNLLGELEDISDDVRYKLEPTLEIIETAEQAMIAKFKDLKAKIKTEFSEFKNKTLKENQDKMTTDKEILEELQCFETLFTSVYEYGTDEQRYIAARVVNEQTTQYKSEVEIQQRELYKFEPSIDCSEELTNLLESDRVLATLHINKVSLNPESCLQDTNTYIQLAKSVAVKQGDATKIPFYTGMDFFPDGKLAMLDNNNNALCIMDTHLEKSYKYKFKGYRYSVAVVSEKEAAVTSGDDYIIEFLHVSHTNVITLTRSIPTTFPYYSICLMNDTTFLVSTYESRHPLRMITLAGEEKDFDGLPQKQYEGGNSSCAYIRSKDKLVLTDRRDSTIYVYDNKNTCVTRTVVKDESIQEPRAVCVGPGDSIFVCSENTNSLVQVSASGKVLGSHKLDMEYPCTMCSSKDGKTLAVSNSVKGNKKVQVFHVIG